MSIAIRRALYGKLSGHAPLTNLLGPPAAGLSKALYHQVAPQGAQLPFVVYFKSAGTPRYGLGSLAYDNEVWTIKGVAEEPAATDTADDIAYQLDALLTDGLLSISGRTQLYLRRESDVEYGEIADGVHYAHSGADYRLIASL